MNRNIKPHFARKASLALVCRFGRSRTSCASDGSLSRVHRHLRQRHGYPGRGLADRRYHDGRLRAHQAVQKGRQQSDLSSIHVIGVLSLRWSFRPASPLPARGFRQLAVRSPPRGRAFVSRINRSGIQGSGNTSMLIRPLSHVQHGLITRVRSWITSMPIRSSWRYGQHRGYK